MRGRGDCSRPNDRFAFDCSTAWVDSGLRICQIGYSVFRVSATDKPLVWLHGEVKTPPFTPAARLEAGTLLRL
jgi:hypothetical protein